MVHNQQIELSGDVAEIIDNDEGTIINIIINRNNISLDLKDEGISLGDKVVLQGNLFVESVTINGIKSESK